MTEAKRVEVLEWLAPGEELSLRWVLEWASGVVKYGKWNCTDQDESTSAWRHSKEGLLWASVEAVGHKREARIVARCTGADFCMFQTQLEQTMRAAVNGDLNPWDVKTRFVGLTIVDRDQKVTIYRNGTAEVEERDPSEDSQHHYGQG